MKDEILSKPTRGESILYYETRNGNIRIEISYTNETFWLTPRKMAKLFSVSPNLISFHLKTICEHKEMHSLSTAENASAVQAQQSRRECRAMRLYNLEVILAVGYRVNRAQATQFRVWAAQRRREFRQHQHFIETPKLWRNRQSLRLRAYDYSTPNGYFITICTQNRACLFGEVVRQRVILNTAGAMVMNTWKSLPKRYPNVQTDAFVLMPNHLHGILVLTSHDERTGLRCDGSRRCESMDIEKPAELSPIPTVGQIVGAFKSLTTIAYGRGVRADGWESYQGRLWQRNYYERIVRDEAALESIRRYIDANPANWANDVENIRDDVRS